MSIIQSGLPLALSLPFILAAWFAVTHRQRGTVNPDPALRPTAEIATAAPVDGFAGMGGDLDTALHEAVLAMASVAHARWVRIELAVGAVLPMPVDHGALWTALRDIMLTAIDAAPGGQVLVTASTVGRLLHIRITDDGAGTDQLTRKTSMRQVEAMLAMQGGTVVVEARPGRGTTVTIGLPMPATTQQYPGSSAELSELTEQAA